MINNVILSLLQYLCGYSTYKPYDNRICCRNVYFTVFPDFEPLVQFDPFSSDGVYIMTRCFDPEISDKWRHCPPYILSA